MSPKNSRLHAAGLTALGLFALAPLGAVADAPPAAPPAPAAPVAPAPVHSVLLLKNGNLQQGLVSDGGKVYFVHGRGGKIPIPKSSVETAGRSVRDIYDYKVARLPQRDPDEHMKLARWCLTQRLGAEAKEQLQKVVALSPRDPQANAMLENIAGQEEREARRDPAVARASLEPQAERPEAIDPALLGRARREMGISPLPQIPGLSPALAVRRSDEFAKYVDVVLQLRCAKCHDEQSPGGFRLVRYRARGWRDRSANALRANLDAVLGLVNLDDPDKSELLSVSLQPHGGGRNAQPVFPSSNNQEYQILAAWVRSLRGPQAAGASRTVAGGAPEADGFGAQRATGSSLPGPLTPTPPSSSLDTRPPLPGASPDPDLAELAKPRNVVLPPSEHVVASHPDASPDAQFPAPFAVSGARPKLPGAPAMPGASPAAPGGLPAAPTGLPPNLPPTGLTAEEIAAAQAKAEAATGAPPLPPKIPKEAADQVAAAKAKSKPIKVDPALLEKALSNRNASPQ